MKNIIITGWRGKIGKFIIENYSDQFDFPVKHIDYTNIDEVREFFNNYKDDETVIVHTAFSGVRNHNQSTEEDYNKNIKMFENILMCRGEKTLVNIGSGIINTDNKNWYAKAKRKISENIKEIDNCCEIIVYGAFDPTEDGTRFFKQVTKNYIENTKIAIPVDRYFGFTTYELVYYAIRDIATPNIYYLNKKKQYCVQLAPKTLSEYALMFSRLTTNQKINIEVEKWSDDGYCCKYPDFPMKAIREEKIYRQIFNKYIESYYKERGMNV